MVSTSLLFLQSQPSVVTTGRLLQCISPLMFGKSEEKITEV